MRTVAQPDGLSVEDDRDCQGKSQKDFKLIVESIEDPFMRYVM